MKKILFITLLILSIACSSFAEEDLVRYSFHDGEFGIWLPESFKVIHENVTEEELAGWFDTQAAKEILSDDGINLYAEYDNENKYLIIYSYMGLHSEKYPFSDWDMLEALGKYWGEAFGEGSNILFTETYHSNDWGDCSGFIKLAYTFQSDADTIYCIEYVTALEEDVISLVFSSYNKQFNIEEEHLCRSITEQLFDNIVTLITK